MCSITFTNGEYLQTNTLNDLPEDDPQQHRGTTGDAKKAGDTRVLNCRSRWTRTVQCKLIVICILAMLPTHCNGSYFAKMVRGRERERKVKEQRQTWERIYIVCEKTCPKYECPTCEKNDCYVRDSQNATGNCVLYCETCKTKFDAVACRYCLGTGYELFVGKGGRDTNSKRWWGPEQDNVMISNRHHNTEASAEAEKETIIAARQQEDVKKEKHAAFMKSLSKLKPKAKYTNKQEALRLVKEYITFLNDLSEVIDALWKRWNYVPTQYTNVVGPMATLTRMRVPSTDRGYIKEAVLGLISALPTNTVIYKGSADEKDDTGDYIDGALDIFKTGMILYAVGPMVGGMAATAVTGGIALPAVFAALGTCLKIPTSTDEIKKLLKIEDEECDFEEKFTKMNDDMKKVLESKINFLMTKASLGIISKEEFAQISAIKVEVCKTQSQFPQSQFPFKLSWQDITITDTEVDHKRRRLYQKQAIAGNH